MEEQIKLLQNRIAELTLENTVLNARVTKLEQQAKELEAQFKSLTSNEYKPLKQYVKTSQGVITVEEPKGDLDE